MKNILFISDTFLEGGMETRISEANREYKKRNIKPFLACDTLKKTIYCKDFHKMSDNFNFIPTNGQLHVKDIIENSNKLVSLCKKEKIDLIECQPFWNLLSATIAAQQCKIPITYTLHGTVSGNFIDPKYSEANVLFYLLFAFGVDQIYAVSKRLSDIYSYISKDIIVTQNGIPLDNFPKKVFYRTGIFAIASRLDQPKTATIIDFLPKLYTSEYSSRIDIYGDGDNFNTLKNFITKNNYDDKVCLHGWVDNLKQKFIKNQYDCVFGVGRVAIDAISTKTPVGVVGSDGFVGLVNKDNLPYFTKNNFLSSGLQEINDIQKELTDLYRNPKKYTFNKNDLDMLDASKIWQQHILLEQNLVFREKEAIKEIMDILIHNQNEELLLGTNLIGSFTSILNKYNQNKLIPAELLIGTASALTNKISKYQEQLSSLEGSLAKLEASTSWRITKPLRKANKIIHNIKKS